MAQILLNKYIKCKIKFSILFEKQISWLYQKHVLIMILNSVKRSDMARCSYSCWKYSEQWNVHMLPFFSFRLFFLIHRAQIHRHVQSHSQHTHPQTHTHATQARHSYHVIWLGIMPTARHVTYQKSLRQSERVREWKRKREGDSAHLWEFLVKCEYSAYTGNMKFSCYSYLQCSVVWGLWFWEKRKEKERKRDTWSLRSNVELFCGTCHVYCSLSPFLEGFLKST